MVVAVSRKGRKLSWHGHGSLQHMLGLSTNLAIQCRRSSRPSLVEDAEWGGP